MSTADELTPAEERVLDLVVSVQRAGDLRPLVPLLRGPDAGRDSAVTSLRILAEWDVEELVQLAVNTLVAEPALADRARRDLEGAARARRSAG